MLKIWLPGESPWAEVLADNPDGSKTVRIDNKVAGDYSAAEFRTRLRDVFGIGHGFDKYDYRKHAFRFNDVVTVRLTTEEPFVWQVVDYAHADA